MEYGNGNSEWLESNRSVFERIRAHDAPGKSRGPFRGMKSSKPTRPQASAQEYQGQAERPIPTPGAPCFSASDGHPYCHQHYFASRLPVRN